MPPSAPLCADAARERDDPIHGTAVHVRRFLLVEHPGPWSFDGMAASDIDPHVLGRLSHATHQADARPLFIRRHGRHQASDERKWAVADIATGRIRWGTWRDDADLLAAADALAEPSTDWSTDPVLLVCTHGNHDTCCAVRGRPVAEALTETHPELTWECSHVGGDRFAASVVVLPDGTYYGRLDASDAPNVIDRHLAGTVTPARLRGSSMLSTVAQAAAVAVHERFGPGGPRDIHSEGVQQVGGGAWRVELGCDRPLPAHVVVSVESRRSPAAVLTCRATQPTSARTFEVTDVRVVEPKVAPP